ncbi:MAG: phosphoribosylglycinamide formyltransferase, partial [bacterium]
MERLPMVNVAVLASGRGSNLEALLQAQRQDGLGPARVAVVVSDRGDAQALELARASHVEALFLDPAGLTREQYDARLADELRTRGIGLIVLAGFMRVLSPALVRAFRDRIVNIHPTLLPSFPGLHGQRQALDWGV